MYISEKSEYQQNKFQFLIGTVKTSIIDILNKDPKVFQFLIGTVKTRFKEDLR